VKSESAPQSPQVGSTTLGPSAADAGAPERPSHRRAAMRGSLFEILGFGSTQLVRLAGNLILTRLLFPEAFGLVAIVTIVHSGLELLSDVGFNQSVIQNRRGDDPDFLDTAFSLQLMRGALLSTLAFALAYPVSLIYGEPMLFWLLAVSAVQPLIAGANSTAIFLLRRRVEFGRLALLEISSQLASVAVMISWATLAPSVWALIAGGFARTLIRCAASHLLLRERRDRFRIEPSAREEILAYGRWILGSSAIFFVSRQADRVILGKLLGMSTLGVFSIAVMLAEVVELVMSRLATNVFFPIFSRIGREDIARMRSFYYRARLPLDAVFGTGMGLLFVLGSTLVELVWDERYADAGWMFELLCVRVAMAIMVYPCDRALLALGESAYPFYRSCVRALWILVTIPLGWYWDGTHGLVVAAALAELPVFFVLWPEFRRHGMLRLDREVLAVGFFALGYGLGRLLDPLITGWLG
jgi:O-antigen/teichoic acid export membrane protein